MGDVACIVEVPVVGTAKPPYNTMYHYRITMCATLDQTEKLAIFSFDVSRFSSVTPFIVLETTDHLYVDLFLDFKVSLSSHGSNVSRNKTGIRARDVRGK